MGFTLRFIILFVMVLFQLTPVLLFLSGIIGISAHFVGKREKWGRFDTFYYACITATTVGYGDFRPKAKRSRVLAIVIALTGLIITGIVVAVAMQALTKAFVFTMEGKSLAQTVAYVIDLMSKSFE